MLEFLLGVLVYGFLGAFMSYALIMVYRGLLPNYQQNEQELKQELSAAKKTVGLGSLVGIAAFVIRHTSH